MNHSSQAPGAVFSSHAPASRGLRLWARATRWLLWLVVAVWGFGLLTWVALHAAIVPRIDGWRPELQRWAGDALGVPVTIGSIRATNRPDTPFSLPPFMPAFEMSDVRLLDAKGRAALVLPRIQASVSVRSLWRLGFEQIVIDSPELDVRRTREGQLEVAGLVLSGSTGASSGADWFFDQTEFAVRGGTLRWTDEQRGAPPLALSAVDLVVRNGTRDHGWRIDATPPADWGGRFTLQGRLREPLLSVGRTEGDRPWDRWSGELHAALPQADVQRLQAYLPAHLPALPGLLVRGGQGRLQLWADVEAGRLSGVQADIDLQAVDVRLGADLPPLAFAHIAGRLQASWSDASWRLGSEDLRFLTREGVAWEGGRFSLAQRPAGPLARGAAPAGQLELTADGIELAAVAALAERLPLPSPVHRWVQTLQPAGRVQNLQARWDGPDLAGLKASGLVQGLALSGDAVPASVDGEAPAPRIGRPGIEGATVQFDLQRDGGTARLTVQDGALWLPGVFEEARLPLTRLDAQARWRLVGERIEVELSEARMSNPDARGTLQARWNTTPGAQGAARFPGVLDLTATLEQANLTRVHRYLPLSVGTEARRYVRESVRAGTGTAVNFRVQGDVARAPFDAGDGTFRISAKLQGLDMDYLPPFLQDAGARPWPGLRRMSGDLVLDRLSLRIDQLAGGLQDAAGVQIQRGRLAIDHLGRNGVLTAEADVQGPAPAQLGFVVRSPLGGMLQGALDAARLSGTAQTRFALTVPLENAAATRVQGVVRLAGNDLVIAPHLPALGRVRGQLEFSETGFNVPAAQARLLGGDVSFSGGLRPDPQGGSRLALRGQGSLSAEALRTAGLGPLSKLAQSASGTAAYTAQVGLRGGAPELQFSSNLQGLALSLPAPLAKPAEASWPLRLDLAVTEVAGPAAPAVGRALADRLALRWQSPAGVLLDARLERQREGERWAVRRGVLAAGSLAGDPGALPEQGVLARLSLPQIDVDAWQAALGGVWPAGEGADAAATGTETPPLWLPDRLELRTDRLRAGGRELQRVQIDASRDSTLWRAQVQADEVAGRVEYRPGTPRNPGQVTARLSRLVLAREARSDVERLLDQPSSVPALDLSIDDLRWGGRSLGRIELQAVNRGAPLRQPEWRLTRLSATVPEARLTASGNWVPLGGNQLTGPGAGAQRRTAIGFQLAVDDAGRLLDRLGREGTVRGGQGRMEGNVGWIGSPLSPDIASLSGQVSVDIERGQFLQIEPGAGRLLGVLSLQSLPRRLVLDFRDVFSQGFAFDFFRGQGQIDQGVLSTRNLQMKGVNAAVLMEGSADLVRETQDLQVFVVPEINAGAASLLAATVNPVVGIGTLLAQLVLRQPLRSVTTQEFRVTGSWADPQVQKVERSAAAPATEPATPLQ